MSNKLKVRAFVASDLGRVQEIRRRAFAPIFQSFRSIVGVDLANTMFGGADEQQGRYLAEVIGLSKGQVFVAEQGGLIVGFVHFEEDADTGVGEIGLNAVDPDFGRRGVGTALYQFAIDHFRARGLTVAKVSTGGDPSHKAARGAYSKVGFGASIPSVTLYQRLR